MNGVAMPGVSAGSNQVGASETWTAHVICPSAGVAADDAPRAATAIARISTPTSARRQVMSRLLRLRGGWPTARIRSSADIELDGEAPIDRSTSDSDDSAAIVRWRAIGCQGARGAVAVLATHR